MKPNLVSHLHTQLAITSSYQQVKDSSRVRPSFLEALNLTWDLFMFNKNKSIDSSFTKIHRKCMKKRTSEFTGGLAGCVQSANLGFGGPYSSLNLNAAIKQQSKHSNELACMMGGQQVSQTNYQ